MSKLKNVGNLIVFVIALVILFGVVRLILPYSSQEVITLTPTHGERIVKDKDSYYLVYTKDEVFKNVDTIFYLKFRSSDLHGKLISNLHSEFSCSVNWYRVPILHMYRNIIDCDLVDEK